MIFYKMFRNISENINSIMNTDENNDIRDFSLERLKHYAPDQFEIAIKINKTIEKFSKGDWTLDGLLEQ